MSLYEMLKRQVIELTRSQYAVLLLDRLFEEPIFQSTHLAEHESMPSKPMVMTLLKTLREVGILKVLREGSGRRAQMLAFAALINLCERKEVI